MNRVIVIALTSFTVNYLVARKITTHIAEKKQAEQAAQARKNAETAYVDFALNMQAIRNATAIVIARHEGEEITSYDQLEMMKKEFQTEVEFQKIAIRQNV